MDRPPCVFTIFTKGYNFHDYLFPWMRNFVDMGPTHKRKNWLPCKFLLACLYEVKESLCITLGEHPCAQGRACEHDQNVQFLGLGQFLSNFKG